MSRIIDITGNKYNKLTVLELAYPSSDKKRTYWKCRCDCGTEVILRKDTFIYPYSTIKSCGCDKLKGR